jgi:hypothetical protein
VQTCRDRARTYRRAVARTGIAVSFGGRTRACGGLAIATVTVPRIDVLGKKEGATMSYMLSLALNPDITTRIAVVVIVTTVVVVVIVVVIVVVAVILTVATDCEVHHVIH